MRLRLGEEFRGEWDRLSFRFCCEHCTYFDRERNGCVHGWPSDEHRLSHYQDETCSVLVFCKEFELD